MRKAFGWLILLLVSTAFSVAALGEENTVLRALIVSADHFITQDDTGTAARTNAQAVQNTLGADARGYQTIRVESDVINSADALREAVMETFGDADEDDISVFYISTHGAYNIARSNATAVLLLSDGQTEGEISAGELQDIFDRIRGKKVLILDACNAGAFIGKGLSNSAEEALFIGSEYKVLCSAGGAEESWYWQTQTGEQHGASYFAAVLTNGLKKSKGFPADMNQDGVITLSEAYQYTMRFYAASTPQAYPQTDDDFVLFSCGETSAEDKTDAVTDIQFDDTVLSGSFNQVQFSFTVRRPVEVIYQLVYYQHGEWQFETAQVIYDRTEGEKLQTGRKTRTLTLSLSDESDETQGYVMVQIFTRSDDNLFWLEGGKLLNVQPAAGDIVINVRLDKRSFRPADGEELAVRVLHDAPCSMTVSVQTMSGETIRYLQYDTPSRPQHLTPEGSCFYWDGCLASGERAPAGRYIIRVRTVFAGRTYVAYSGTVTLRDTEGTEG